MKWRGIALGIVAILVLVSTTRANITNLTYASDGDGAFVCSNYLWQGSSPSVNFHVYGDQFSAPGHMLTDVLTDSANDPALIIGSSVDNDTGFAWTSYLVNVYMATTFTITNVTVTSPLNDWTVVSVSPVTFTGSNFVANIVYDTGTPIAIGDTLDFSYKLQFASSTHYAFTQEMIPVPEPGTVVMVTMSGLLFASLALARRRHRA